MNNPSCRIKRLLLAGGLTLGVLATAAVGGHAAGAQAAPISPLKVQAGGTEATLSFTTAEPASVTIDYKPTVAMAATASSAARQRSAPSA